MPIPQNLEVCAGQSTVRCFDLCMRQGNTTIETQTTDDFLIFTALPICSSLHLTERFWMVKELFYYNLYMGCVICKNIAHAEQGPSNTAGNLRKSSAFLLS